MATQGMRGGFNGLTSDDAFLQGLTEIEFIRDLLSTLDDNRTPQRQIQDFAARTLRKHLRKTVIEYNVKFSDATEKDYVGLHRESDKRLEQTFSILRLLRANGFDETSPLKVPGPIAYMPSLSFLMMEKAEGETLRELFENPRTDPGPSVRLAAQWLAKLHGSKISLDRFRSTTDETALSLKYEDALVRVFPNYSQTIERLCRKLVEKQEASRFEARPIHGDYHPRNIIIAPSNHAAVIDFEESCMGDPAFDLGYFVAQSKMSHGIRPVTLRATSVFLHEYARASLPDDHLLERARIHEAQTYLQRIYHTYYLLALQPNPDLISEWLNESETCLREAENTP